MSNSHQTDVILYCIKNCCHEHEVSNSNFAKVHVHKIYFQHWTDTERVHFFAIELKRLGMGQAGFCPSQVKSSFFENQNFKLKYFSNIWISSLIKPSFFNYKIFKPSQAQIYWVSSQVKSSIFNIWIFKSNQVKLKLFDLTCQVAWTFFSKNLISIDLIWKNLYWNCKLT